MRKKHLGLFSLLFVISLFILPGFVQACYVPSEASQESAGTLTFIIPQQTGTIAYTGGSVSVESVLAEGTSFNSGSHLLSGGMLTYSAADSTISLSGGFSDASIADNTTLFSGKLTSISTLSGSGTFPVTYTFALLSGTQDAVLSKYFFGSTPHKFGGALTVLQAGDDVFGAMKVQPVSSPIPPAALLLGGGLMGVGIVRKRIRKQK